LFTRRDRTALPNGPEAVVLEMLKPGSLAAFQLCAANNRLGSESRQSRLDRPASDVSGA
jgi:hypothetical protein